MDVRIWKAMVRAERLFQRADAGFWQDAEPDAAQKEAAGFDNATEALAAGRYSHTADLQREWRTQIVKGKRRHGLFDQEIAPATIPMAGLTLRRYLNPRTNPFDYAYPSLR